MLLFPEHRKGIMFLTFVFPATTIIPVNAKCPVIVEWMNERLMNEWIVWFLELQVIIIRFYWLIGKNSKLLNKITFTSCCCRNFLHQLSHGVFLRWISFSKDWSKIQKLKWLIWNLRLKVYRFSSAFIFYFSYKNLPQIWQVKITQIWGTWVA